MSEASNTKVYPIELMYDGYVHEIKFKCNNEIISMKNLPTNDERAVIDKLLRKADIMSKCIVASVIAVLIGGLFGLVEYVLNVTHAFNWLETGAAIILIALFYFVCQNAEGLSMRYALRKLMESDDMESRATVIPFIGTNEEMKNLDWLKKFQTKLYILRGLSESIWTFLYRRSQDEVVKAYFEALVSDNYPNANIRYQYADYKGDVVTERINISVTVTENVNLETGHNVLDFKDMTFRMERKPKINEDDRDKYRNAWSKLKDELFSNGYEAIRDFLDYDYNPKEDKDTTEIRLDQAFDQMPLEEYVKFLDKYHVLT